MVKDGTGAKLYSLDNAANELGGISVWTLRGHAKQGSIRVTRIGRRVLISSVELARIQLEGLPSLCADSIRPARETKR
jgi:hypothetical protein